MGFCYNENKGSPVFLFWCSCMLCAFFIFFIYKRTLNINLTDVKVKYFIITNKKCMGIVI